MHSFFQIRLRTRNCNFGRQAPSPVRASGRPACLWRIDYTALRHARRMSARTAAGRCLPLKLLRLFEQFDHAFEQTPGPAAVETAMIETQCDLRLGLRNEFVFFFAPRRNFFPNAETEQKRLVRQRNRRAPFDTESSEI